MTNFPHFCTAEPTDQDLQAEEPTHTTIMPMHIYNDL